ncbi:MAG: adenine deaminase [Candidatus Krumholzibacteria bacterium]|jgi:adenine deaminase|nr:adenine deaminase [Candidatus Krumholzibacteria bacterium]
MSLEHRIDVAMGRVPADRVFKNGYHVNVFTNTIDEGDIAVADHRIAGIGAYEGKRTVDLRGQVVCPGFIDAHVHIESSMLSVQEFARTVVACGTTSVIADPHEIANVMGIEGIRFILRSSKYCPIHIYVMLSSCVPASSLESSGAELSAVDLLPFLSEKWVLGLGEMMNYHGVINGDPEVLDKIRVVGHKSILDGHCPGLSGRDLCAYICAGIRTDHESTTYDEAQEKLRLGMNVMIREGTAARDLDELLPLVTPETVTRFMFVTDDKHVDDLLAEGQIDHMVRRAIARGLPPPHAIRMASFNAARFYNLEALGAVGPGYWADLVVLNDLHECRVTQVYKKGELVAQDGVCVAARPPLQTAPTLRASVNVKWLQAEDFAMPVPAGKEQARVRVIEAIPDRLHTQLRLECPAVADGMIVSDPARGLIKAAVIERHVASGRIGLGLIRGFGIRRGAIASTVAHDAHNLIVLGATDADMLAAAIHIIRIGGGLCVLADGEVLADLPLPIAGLLTDDPAPEVVRKLQNVRQAAHSLGTSLACPFMTLAFMSLSVIGDLKLTDKGLVDVTANALVPLFAD